jgi:hypothetical protein
MRVAFFCKNKIFFTAEAQEGTEKSFFIIYSVVDAVNKVKLFFLCDLRVLCGSSFSSFLLPAANG